MNAFQRFLLRRVRRYADVVHNYPVPAWALRRLARFCFDQGETELADTYRIQYLRAKNFLPPANSKR